MPAPLEITFTDGDEYIELSEEDGLQFSTEKCPYEIVSKAIQRYFWRLNNFTGWSIEYNVVFTF